MCELTSCSIGQGAPSNARGETPPLRGRCRLEFLERRVVGTVTACQPRFMKLAARGQVPEDAARKFEQLVLASLDRNGSFVEAMLTGYQAFLCSDLFLYLREPKSNFAVADRLSHFLINTRPDVQLLAAPLKEPQVLRREADRLKSPRGAQPMRRAPQGQRAS